MRTETEFFGVTAEPKRDYPRLKKQSERVLEALSDGEWHTLSQISILANAPEASASARLRGLKACGNPIEKKNAGGGTWWYRLILPAQRNLF